MKRKKMTYTLVILTLLAALTVWVLYLPIFGKAPEGERLDRVKRLRNYRDGELQNLSPTPVKPEGVTYWDMLKAVIKGNERSVPTDPLPHVKPDFRRADSVKVTWFGHSSYLVQADGMNVLVDPVFSKRVSPFSFIGSKQYPGTDFISLEDLPALDVILITHDHYDHLDYFSIVALKDKTNRFVTSLGVGAHLEHWGVAANKITELAWGENTVEQSLSFTALAARHFSGRLFKRNQTLWSAFVLQTANNRLYLGGDSGYDTHFKAAGEQYGPFDLALLECGQYNAYWPLIHMFPEQTVQAALDLNARVLMPVHWGKFSLALHDWDEPVIRVTREAKKRNLRITTPMLGESVIFGVNYPDKAWWQR
ncbi:MBL fold metallo-hydrolase [Pedobacter faecalis]|uniref:MBL fold metallo-hydrolase n=1 Tax=Pedobacter faecalis TaxID=3041495 RepID=UPI00254D3921|nr:MBL fold metallo-hydrolase [Pedobacter sp. ELA7]